jgi:hypothetical protein
MHGFHATYMLIETYLMLRKQYQYNRLLPSFSFYTYYTAKIYKQSNDFEFCNATAWVQVVSESVV